MLRLRKTLPFLVYAGLGLLIGWGWAAISRYGEKTEIIQKSRNQKGTSASGSAGDILGLARKARWIREQQGDSIEMLVSHWSDDEMVAALNEEPLGKDVLLRVDSVSVKLVGELSRRDPVRALAWVKEQPAIFYPKFAESLIAGWLPHRIDEAFAVVAKHPELFGGAPPANLVKISLEQASDSGPDQFISSLKALVDTGASSGLGPAHAYPLDFDFSAVLGSDIFSKYHLYETKNHLLCAWLKTDRDAAFQWMVENEDSRIISMWMEQSTTTTYTEKAAFSSWLLNKVEQLPLHQRAEFAEQITRSFNIGEYDAIQWINAASTSEMKDMIRFKAATRILSSDRRQVEACLDAIATLPDVESRLRLLEKVRPYVSSLSGAVLHDEGERTFRVRLKEWGVESTRCDRIVELLSNEFER